MLPLRPTLTLQVWKQSGSDIYGQPQLLRQADEQVAPVKLIFDDQHSTVRTDSSGSHGHAYETTATVTVLARPRTAIALGDMLVITGRKVRVNFIHERYTPAGVHHHTEVRGIAWV